MAHDVFVSYASEDKTVADAVCGTLEANGVRCWIAPRDVIPGQPYGEAIIEAIHGCRIMVLIFSSHANASGHIPKEIERAVSKGVTIMPFRIEGVTPGKSLDYFIGSVHWLDALAPPLEGHLQKLASNVQLLLSRGAPEGERKPEERPRPPVAPAVQVAPPAGRSIWIYAALGAMAVATVALAGVLLFRKPPAPAPATSASTTATATPAPSGAIPAAGPQPGPARPSTTAATPAPSPVTSPPARTPAGIEKPGRNQGEPKSEPASTLRPSSETTIFDAMQGATIGDAHGIQWINAFGGHGAAFSSQASSRIEYPNGIPSEGTLELWLKINNGYRYNNYEFLPNQSSAMVFSTDVEGGDVAWPGTTKFSVTRNGDIIFWMATSKYNQPPAPSLEAHGTTFRFGEWHALGVSYGSEGQYIMLDGQVVASAPNWRQILGRAGNHQTPLDIPTIGQTVSHYWPTGQYGGGFEGIVAIFRTSSKQRDWLLARGIRD